MTQTPREAGDAMREAAAKIIDEAWFIPRLSRVALAAKIRSLPAAPSEPTGEGRDEPQLRCAICGFVIDHRYEAAKPTVDFTMAGRVKHNNVIATLRADLARMTAERDEARAAGKAARLREKAAEDQRVSAVDDLARMTSAMEKLKDEALTNTRGREQGAESEYTVGYRDGVKIIAAKEQGNE